MEDEQTSPEQSQSPSSYPALTNPEEPQNISENKSSKQRFITRIKSAIPTPVFQAIAIATLVSMIIMSAILVMGKPLLSKQGGLVTGSIRNKCSDEYSQKYQYPGRNSSQASYRKYYDLRNNYVQKCAEEEVANIRQPSIILLALVGLALIVIIGIVLSVAKKYIGFTRSWFLAALALNSVIIAMKFVGSPYLLYKQVITVETGSLNPSFDPSNASIVMLTACVIFLLYYAVLSLFYFSYKRLFRSVEVPSEIKKPKPRKKKLAVVGIVALLAIIFFGSGLLLLLIIPFIFLGSTYSYLSYVIGSFTLLLIAGIGLLALMFDSVRQQIRSQGNITLLASAFYLMLCLLLSIHILWVLYIMLLSTLWPFNITYYSSK